MTEKLERLNLEKITIATKEIRWFEKGKEIIIHNTLFDVKTTVVKKDSTIFYGLFDEKETLVKNRVDLLVEQQNNQSTSNKLSITQLIFQLWYCVLDVYNLSPPSGTTLVVNTVTYREDLIEIYASPLAPPPKM